MLWKYPSFLRTLLPKTIILWSFLLVGLFLLFAFFFFFLNILSGYKISQPFRIVSAEKSTDSLMGILWSMTSHFSLQYFLWLFITLWVLVWFLYIHHVEVYLSIPSPYLRSFCHCFYEESPCSLSLFIFLNFHNAYVGVPIATYAFPLIFTLRLF